MSFSHQKGGEQSQTTLLCLHFEACWLTAWCKQCPSLTMSWWTLPRFDRSRWASDAAVVARHLRKVSFSLTTWKGLFVVPHWCLYWWRSGEQVSFGWTEKRKIVRHRGATPVKTRHYRANDAVAQTLLSQTNSRAYHLCLFPPLRVVILLEIMRSLSRKRPHLPIWGRTIYTTARTWALKPRNYYLSITVPFNVSVTASVCSVWLESQLL